MKTYIFSNCKKSDDETYTEKLLKIVKPTDQLIILNKGTVFFGIVRKNRDIFKNFKNINTLHREIRINGALGFFGIQDMVSFEKLIQSTTTCDVWLDEHHHYAHICKGTKGIPQVSNRIIELPELQQYFDKTGKIPTTGFVSYYLVPKLYHCKKQDITLVNFYGNEDNSTNKAVVHAWNYENEWLKDKKRIFI